MAVGSVGSLAGKIAKMISSDSSKKSILSALRKQGHDSDEILTAYNKASGAVSNPPSVASGLKDKLPAMREATLPTPSPIQAQPQMLKQLGSAPTSSLSKPADISNEASEAIKSGKSLFDTLGKKAALGAGAAGTAIGAGMYLSDDDKQAEEMQGKIDKSTDILNTDTEDDDGEVVPKGPEEWEKTLNGLSRISHTLPDKQQKLWDKKIRDLKTVRDDAINRNEWLSVAETLGQALVQLGAGYHGLRTGRDLSGIQFQKKDWSKNIDQIMDKYKVDAQK